MEDNDATQTSQQSAHKEGLARLRVFTGKWTGQAELKPSGGSAATEEAYEWFPGDFFLINRGWMDVGGKLESIRILEYAAGQYLMHSFDNTGFHRVYRGTVQDNTWKFMGEFERATVTFSNDGNTMTSNWERAEDGWNWQPMCDIIETKT